MVDGFIYMVFISLQAILLTIYCNMAEKGQQNLSHKVASLAS